MDFNIKHSVPRDKVPFAMTDPQYVLTRRFLLILLFTLIIISGSNAQRNRYNTQTPPQLVPCIIIDGDTFIYRTLPTFILFSPKVFKSNKEKQHYYKLVRNVKKVYPYARLAGIKLREYNELILANPDKKKELMKRAEADLEAEFGNELKKLTFSQGVILLKLVDRETGQTGYELVADLRGTFRAFFWQGLGRLFGYNLKVKYEPRGADREIEEIVLKIMYGQL